jgi:hypothetical protein
MNRPLADWFRSGFQDHQERLAEAEGRTTAATLRCVTTPTLESRTVATAAADEFVMAARDAAAWLKDHPAPEEAVNGPFTVSFAAYLEAAQMLVGMGEDLSKMTEDQGSRAAAAVARARAANYDAAYAFQRLVLQ